MGNPAFAQLTDDALFAEVTRRKAAGEDFRAQLGELTERWRDVEIKQAFIELDGAGSERALTQPAACERFKRDAAGGGIDEVAALDVGAHGVEKPTGVALCRERGRRGERLVIRRDVTRLPSARRQLAGRPWGAARPRD